VVENLVIIPAHNEIVSIEKIIRGVFSLSMPFHILVIDNFSTDDTSHRMTELRSEFQNKLFLIENKKKHKIGNSYILGFRWALSNGYEYIFQMDPDFGHHAEDLVKLYEACQPEEVDVVIGSRYQTGLNVVNVPMRRILASYLASAYVRRMTGMKIKDTTTGFACFKRSALKDIDLEMIGNRGSAFQIAIKHASWQKGHKIIEIPVIFANTQSPSARISTRVIGDAMFGVLKLRIWQLFRGKKPLS
jgi:dolichol-phosphate mannosyltransferase